MANSITTRLTEHIMTQARAVNYTPGLSSYAVDISRFNGELDVDYWERTPIELPNNLGHAFFTWDGQPSRRLTCLVMVPNDLAHEINERRGQASPPMPGRHYHLFTGKGTGRSTRAPGTPTSRYITRKNR